MVKLQHLNRRIFHLISRLHNFFFSRYLNILSMDIGVRLSIAGKCASQILLNKTAQFLLLYHFLKFLLSSASSVPSFKRQQKECNMLKHNAQLLFFTFRGQILCSNSIDLKGSIIISEGQQTQQTFLKLNIPNTSQNYFSVRFSN